MPNLTPSVPPVLTLAVRALEETDFATPATWSDIHQVLLDNDAALKALVDALALGTSLAANSVTDVAIGSRTVNQALAPSTDANTLTNLLGNLANRVHAITGAANWRATPASTLAEARTHIDATAPHAATAAATANRLMLRDAAGRAKVAAPLAADDIARKQEVDTATAGLAAHLTSLQVHVPAGAYVARTPRADQLVAYADLFGVPATFPAATHNHDERYYTESELGATGAVGAVVHADRVSAGILAAARIPNLDAAKVTSGVFSTARIPTITASKLATTNAERDWVLARTGNAPVGSIGSYALLHYVGVTAPPTPGGDVAGTVLRYANTEAARPNGFDPVTTVPGSWRLMGYLHSGTAAASLWVRIA